MRDEDHGHGAFAFQIRQERENLRLDGNVQSRSGLVSNQQPRLACQGDREHHSLSHSSRQLVRVLLHASFGIGDPNPAQQCERSQSCFAPRQTQVHDERLCDLIADDDVRCERGHGVLKDHADAQASDAIQFRGPLLQERDRTEGGASPGSSVRRQQTQGGQKRLALAGPGFADDTEALAGLHTK